MNGRAPVPGGRTFRQAAAAKEITTRSRPRGTYRNIYVRPATYSSVVLGDMHAFFAADVTLGMRKYQAGGMMLCEC